MPPVNKPPPTAAALPRQAPAAAADATALFASAEWAAVHSFAKEAARDYEYTNTQNRVHRRRATVPLEVPEERALALTGGKILDLRGVGSGPDPARATTVAIDVPETDLDIAAIRRAATESGFPDLAILDELEFGLDNGSRTPRKVRVASGHKGSFEYRDHITKELAKETSRGWIEGPFEHPPFWPLRCVELNVVEQVRPDKTKLRITTDFSESGTDDSINKGIDLRLEPPLKMCRLLEFCHAAAVLEASGHKVFAWMTDISAAYRHWPVATVRRWQQCRLWNGKFYVDLRGVFGDRALVGKFSRCANLIVWVVSSRLRRLDAATTDELPTDLAAWQRARAERLGIDAAVLFFAMEYIDDLGGVSIGEARAQRHLDVALDTLREFGFPPAADKTVAPGRRGVILGGAFDFEERTVRLSDTFWWKVRARTQRLLDAADGGYDFTDLSKVVHSHAHIALFYPRLKPEAAASFAFYYRAKALRPRCPPLHDDFRRICDVFLQAHAEEAALPLVPVLHFPRRGHHLRIDLETDASSTIGWGVVCLPPEDSVAPVLYAAGRWLPEETNAHINVKELYTTLLAAALFGDIFPGSWVLEAIDNTAAKLAAAANKSSAPLMRALLERRAALHQRFAWTTHLQYLRSADNDLADPLSRDDHAAFITNAINRGIPELRLRRLDLDPNVRRNLAGLLTLPAPAP